ncbi:MAG: universal stress protein [Caballeronia sp.]|jgi:nucleotide-binding universal stress UspA family protein|uniref:universal stress protein n=1 Tax=Caballeronia sp. TaxID=1931223 RepID=UPI00260ADA66|nr:universal stress protein [Caballeronia sp.]MDB5836805.1 universal stress protein [Caballeronia sp.]
MLRVLIPVINKDGALQAARHAVFLFSEHCVSEVELMEVLESPEQGHASAFHSRGSLRLQEKRAMLSALSQTRAILDDAGVPYHWSRVFGPVAGTIAARAAEKRSDIVLVDASHLGFFTRWRVMNKLWRSTQTPVTMVH